MHEMCTSLADTTVTVPEKSPTAATTCSGFISLNPEKLSQEEKELLHQRLYADSEDMMYKFQDLFSATTDSLKERKVPVTMLTQHLGLLGSIKPTFKDSGIPPLRHQLRGLTNAETVDAVMSVVSDYCSFFNYRMLEHILNKFGTECDKERLEKYKEEFALYGERHVFHCPPVVGEMSTEGHANLFVTLDDSFDGCTVNHLRSFIGNLQKLLGLPSDAVLKLCRIESGSIKLIFQLLHFFQQEIFPLSSEKESELACLGVAHLSCGDYQFTAKDDKVLTHMTFNNTFLNVYVFRRNQILLLLEIQNVQVVRKVKTHVSKPHIWFLIYYIKQQICTLCTLLVGEHIRFIIKETRRSSLLYLICTQPRNWLVGSGCDIRIKGIITNLTLNMHD